MSKQMAPVSWEEAIREHLLHLRATRAPKTVRYYSVQIGQLAKWANDNGVPFVEFRKRHLDRYIAHRLENGCARLTVHHDGVTAKAFFAWCAKEDLIDRSPLAEYEVHRAPKPAKHMPTDDEMARLLEAVAGYWDPKRNTHVGFMPASARIFHRERNGAIIMGLIDSACRIGEMLNLKVTDYRSTAPKAIVIRESKGKEPRTLPVTREWAEALDAWLRVRERVMSDVPADDDEGWLFVSDTGGRLDEIRFLKTLKRVRDFAGIESPITLHSLRRFSLNKLAKHNLLMAQAMAGHKDTKTTLIYTKLDPDFVREEHDQVGVLRGVVTNKRLAAKKRQLV